ncbi:MAG: glycosyltransferase family 9 protein [Candidatus Staskawiczbacteria bacterium]|nr:glycosyltransferase family 9 protein [Candidatus Staskawiczbacteria bacterium]
MIHKKIFYLISGLVKKLLFWFASQKKIGPAQKTIHIVRLDTIGDFVLFSTILSYFRKLYPGHKIVLIVDGVVSGLADWVNKQRVLGGESNYFDEIIAIDGKQYNRNFFYYYAILKKIRLSAPKIVIQPTFSRTPKSDEIVFISKEAQKIAYEGDFSNIATRRKEKNNAKYSRLIKNPMVISEPEINKHFINELAGYQIEPAGLPQWEISQELKVKMKQKLESLGIDFSKPLITVCPGASRPIKTWPAEHFISLIKKLHETKPVFQFLLAGGPKEKELCLDVQKTLGMKNVYDICGQLTLPELAATLSFAVLYIGNDTGAMHIACAVGVSAVGIVAGEHGTRFFPYPAWKEGAQNRAVFNKTGGIGVADITVEDVLGEVLDILH